MQKQEILYEGENCVLLNLRDVTDSRLLELERQCSQVIKKLNFTFSQDLTAPLSLIIVITECLQDMCQSSPHKTEMLKMLKQITSAAQMAFYKLKDLVVVCQSTDKVLQSKERFDLVEATDEVCKLAELQTEGKRVTLEVNFDEIYCQKMDFDGDRDLYQQVLLNVISNAVKFSPEKSCVDIMVSA